jgi:hypothetical protein
VGGGRPRGPSLSRLEGAHLSRVSWELKPVHRKRKRQNAELRVVVRASNEYAVVFYASLQGTDLYCGPRLNVGHELFRASYHESGMHHLRIPTFEGRTISEPGVPLAQITGKQRLGASSGNMSMLQWGYQPRHDSDTRRTLILDLLSIKVLSWTTELWALEPGQPKLLEEALEFYKPSGEVIAHLLIDRCTPNLLAVVWTLIPDAWAALERSVSRQSS